MGRDHWGRGPRRPKQKRDAWAKPKRNRRAKEFGSVPKKDRTKKARAWGRPEGDKAKGILAKFGSSRKGGWLSKLFGRDRGPSLREYYAKLDKTQASEIQAGIREGMAQYYQDRIDRAETVTDKLTRFVEGIMRRRLSPGQLDQVKQIAGEAINPRRVIAFVTNFFK